GRLTDSRKGTPGNAKREKDGVSAHRSTTGTGGRNHSRKSAHSGIDRIVGELHRGRQAPHSARSRIYRFGHLTSPKADFESKQVGGIGSQLPVLELQEAFHHQRGTDEEHHGQRDLRRDQYVAKDSPASGPAVAAPRRVRGSGQMQA